MSISKPVGAPGCWGAKYQDGDRECGQCRFNDTCRPRMFEVLNESQASSYRAPPAPPPPPISPSYQSLPVYQSNKPTGVVPIPPRPVAVPVPAAPPQVPVRYASPSAQQPVPQPTYQQPQPYQHQYHNTGYSIPDPYHPNPTVPMHRPGAPGPAYYFTQYPDETVAARLTKNMMLRGLEAIFSELMYFFRHWTWPPRQ